MRRTADAENRPSDMSQGEPGSDVLQTELPTSALGLFDAAAIAAAVCTTSGVILHANPAWLGLFRLSPADGIPTLAELLGFDTTELLATDTPAGGTTVELSVGDSSHLSVPTHVRPANAGELRLVQIEDTTAFITKIETLERLAHEDALTGLLNRRGFLAEAERLAAIARREHRSLAMLFVDIDGLKQINDDHGHHIGDAIIVDTARLLQRVFRTADALGRYGGDEFCVLALTNGPRSAEHLVQRLTDAVSEHRAAHRDIELQLTAGAVSIDDLDVETVADAIVRADRLMYAKRAVSPDC